ncbi:MAG: cytochrome c [Flavobacteriaceae bacterium]
MRNFKRFLSLAFLGLLLFSCQSKEKNNPEKNEYVASKSIQQKTDLQKSIERGREVYDGFCVQCHLPNGKGTKGIFPPLDGADWLTEKRAESIHAVKYGQKGEIVVNGVTYNNVMPPMGLSDREVADVMNYIMNSWSNTQNKKVTIEEVKGITN